MGSAEKKSLSLIETLRECERENEKNKYIGKKRVKELNI